MYDNKIRLSQDVLEKAELIAHEWGLKNARAAIEAVFRKYSDAYLQGNGWAMESQPFNLQAAMNAANHQRTDALPGCEALNELDDLLGL